MTDDAPNHDHPFYLALIEVIGDTEHTGQEVTLTAYIDPGRMDIYVKNEKGERIYLPSVGKASITAGGWDNSIDFN